MAAVLTAPAAVAPSFAQQDQGQNGPSASQLLRQPVSGLHPGDVPVDPGIKNPLAGDPQAVQTGMQLFASMNCIGCHADNGGGGMGPALSNSQFIYGSAPADIFLTIAQGRPNGMPAWRKLLPDDAIWQLVSYVESISKEPAGSWGKTISRTPVKAPIEQVPAEFQATATPWQFTEPFGNGRRPLNQP